MVGCTLRFTFMLIRQMGLVPGFLRGDRLRGDLITYQVTVRIDGEFQASSTHFTMALFCLGAGSSYTVQYGLNLQGIGSPDFSGDFSGVQPRQSRQCLAGAVLCVHGIVHLQ